MRNIHLLEQFMQENGIEYDKPFTVEFKDGNKTETQDLQLCLLDDKDMYCELVEAYTDDPLVDEERTLFMLLFSDNVKIVKKPWKPEDGEKYWYVWFDESCDCCVGASHWERNSADFTRYVVKNCFKTQKEAVEHADEVLKTLRGEPLVKWEE